MLRLVFLFAAVLFYTNAFAPSGRLMRARTVMKGDQIDKILTKLEREKILTKTAQLGLLSKLDRAGLKLSTVSPLLVKADELDLLGLVSASSDKVLGLAVTAVEFSPALLPIVGGVVKAGPTPLLAGAVASLAGAGAVIAGIPDDSVANVALQTALAVPLGAIVPGACIVGAGVLSKLK